MWSRVIKFVPVSLFERFHGLFDSIPTHLVERPPCPHVRQGRAGSRRRARRGPSGFTRALHRAFHRLQPGQGQPSPSATRSRPASRGSPAWSRCAATARGFCERGDSTRSWRRRRCTGLRASSSSPTGTGSTQTCRTPRQREALSLWTRRWALFAS